MKSKIWAIVFALLGITNFCLLSLASWTALGYKQTSSDAAAKTGYAQIKVLEAGSLKPIDNATVCIIETKSYCYTDKYGNAPKQAIPIVPNNNYDISLARNWGEFTILVYKPGYCSYISFYNEIYAGSTRVGIVCMLSPIINDNDPRITTNVVTPNEAWVETLIALFKK